MRGINNDLEYLRPPEEFPPPAEQTAPPPPEFGEAGQSASPVRKKRKHHWLAAAVAAGLLSTVALFSDAEKAILEQPFVSPTPFAVVAAATPTSSPALDHTPSPSPVPTAAATPTPEPTLSPKPTPKPETSPDADLVFYRTSEVYHLQVLLKATDKITAVTSRMIDRGNQETMWEHVFSEEEIGFGWYILSDYDLYAGEYVKDHMDLVREGYEPDPVLEVTYTARIDDGTEETVTKQAEAADELWISARYDLKDPDEDFLHYFMEETTYPDCFVLRIDPTIYGDLNVTYGEDVELQPGDVSVTLSVNGQSISAETCHLEKDMALYSKGMRFTYAFVMPRPDSFPEHGTAEVTITRRLIHYPTHTRSDVKNVDY